MAWILLSLPVLEPHRCIRPTMREVCVDAQQGGPLFSKPLFSGFCTV